MTATSTHLTRRSLLGAAAASAIAAGCESPSASGQVLKVFNWSDYVNPAAIESFEAAHGCRVVYDNFSSDSELEARLATGGGAYDVVFPSDRAMHSLLAKGLLQPLNRRLLTNTTNLNPDFLGRSFDPQNRFSLPYFWGTVAVGVRKDDVKENVTGFEVLFDRRYRGRITMLDDLENVVAAVLMYLERPLNSVATGDLTAARQLLLAQKPLVQAYTSDAYRERLISGDAWVSLGWSGDLLQAATIAAEQGDAVDVIVPQQGTLLWLDSMAIPARATNVSLAHRFIDHLLSVPVAVRNAEYVHYATPNAAAFAKLDPASAADPRIYPATATLAKCQWLEDRGEEIAKIEAIWREVRA